MRINLLFFNFFTLLLLASVSIYGQASAGKILKERMPDVKWTPKSMETGDFNFDGKPDFALRGVRGKNFVLGIVEGPTTHLSHHWAMEFHETSGHQEGLCSVSEARIYRVEITNEYREYAKEVLTEEFQFTFDNIPKGSFAIRIADGLCDSFNIFWDRNAKDFNWWRI